MERMYSILPHIYGVYICKYSLLMQSIHINYEHFYQCFEICRFALVGFSVSPTWDSNDHQSTYGETPNNIRPNSEQNETCNRCLDRNKRWTEKNREREKKKRDEQKEEKKE